MLLKRPCHPWYDASHFTSTCHFILSVDLEHVHNFYIAILIYISCIAIVNIFGNSLVLLVIKRTESLKNTTSYFLASLACVDLTFGIFALPIWLPVHGVFHFSFNGNVTAPDSSWQKACLTAFFYSIGGIGEGLATLLVALDRFIYIVYPLKYHLLITEMRAKSLILAKWITIFVIATVTTFYPCDRSLMRVKGCLPSVIYASTVNTYFATPFFALVTLMMCILYGKIAWVASKKSTVGIARNIETHGSNQQPPQLTTQVKVTKMIMPIIGIYLTTSALYSLSIISASYVDNDTAQTPEYLGIAISHINHCHWTNFGIYTFR